MLPALALILAPAIMAAYQLVASLVLQVLAMVRIAREPMSLAWPIVAPRSIVTRLCVTNVVRPMLLHASAYEPISDGPAIAVARGPPRAVAHAEIKSGKSSAKSSARMRQVSCQPKSLRISPSRLEIDDGTKSQVSGIIELFWCVQKPTGEVPPYPGRARSSPKLMI